MCHPAFLIWQVLLDPALSRLPPAARELKRGEDFALAIETILPAFFSKVRNHICNAHL